jgi:hypothetical protein
MIAELVDGREHQLPIWGKKELMDDVPKYAFPRARCEHEDMLAKESAQRGLGDVRIPWIHNKELDSFQLLKTLL